MDPKQREQLIELAAEAASKSVDIVRLKQVFKESMINDLKTSSYLPDYLLIELAEKYGIDCGEYKVEREQ